MAPVFSYSKQKPAILAVRKIDYEGRAELILALLKFFCVGGPVVWALLVLAA